MSKLFKLKEWLSTLEAGKRLSLSFGEDVSEADVLQLALDGHLQLSVHLVNGAYARRCAPVGIEEIEWEELPLPNGTVVKIPVGGRVFQRGEQLFQVVESVEELKSGIWDLPMIGGERFDVEHQLQQIVSGIEVTMVSLEGILLSTPDGGLYEIQSRFQADSCRGKSFFDSSNFHPAGALPEDSLFVVRTAAIRSLEQSVNEVPATAEKQGWQPMPATTRTDKKLTPQQEAAIVAAYDGSRGVSVNQLSKQYGVSRPTIDKVLKESGVKT